MSVINEDYFKIILNKASEYHHVQIYGEVIQPQHDQLRNRASMIFVLECLLHIHREKFANLWSPLTGRDALTHLLVQKYNYSISEVRDLSLKDSLLLLQEEMRIINLPTEVVTIINNYSAMKKKQFPSLNDDEWDPELYLQIPKQQNW